MTHPQKGHKNLREGRFSDINSLYFITINAVDRRPFLSLPVLFSAVLESLANLHERQIIEPLCFVALPEHIHLVFQLLQTSLAKVISPLKSYSALRTNAALGRSGPVWARQYFEHRIRSNESLNQIIDYCRNNPVRRELATTTTEWRYWWCCFDK
jgi:putative transposase